MNDTYYVTAGDQNLVLRIYRHGWRTHQEIDGELRAIRFATRRGISAAPPRPAPDGGLIHEVAAPEGLRYAVLFERAPGINSWGPLPLARCRSYGRLAAQLHDRFDSMQRNVRRFNLDTVHLLDEPLSLIEPVLRDRPETWGFLTEIAGRIAPKIADLPRDGGSFGLCHGDLHVGNVTFDDHETPTLFDFDCCGYGWRAYDLAVFRWSSLGSGNESARMRRWNQFLAGYQESRELPEGFEDAVPLFLVARTIWLMGLHLSLVPKRYGMMGLSDPYLRDRYFDDHCGGIRDWIKRHRVLRD